DKESGKLLPCFIAISNIKSKDMDQVRKGNERVIVPRLSDAMFFWETDKAASLASRECELDGIVFQKKLGSIGDK
ncbi:MAG: glycine--tRNA ligase subunit beta, partial [Gammaproteobacteria bacterium]|nr:glycine--tRNA ligase subunit beta [Phycisphaerae bacterium]NIR94940.1 glycine--tRNA ligase subunit beta [Gammaproteobacteria bacterium]NIW45374.1 glycine--tRNA ligase subunit beta [Gammaproteobacteria bacterium]NIX30157.1 glycine--tRNA ligase subunit beta [Phycisphaerae bacterium]NIX56596.1 glycine--tRNA ligase subunit beta [candidate division Zixibacteria bacterium]